MSKEPQPMSETQLSLLSVAADPRPEKRGKRRREEKQPWHFLLLLFAYLDLKVKAREFQLVQAQAHNNDLLARLAVLQDDNQHLKEDLKDAKKAGQPPKKRIRVYNRQCVNCTVIFEAKSFDRNYCDKCRDIGEQRRKGFNRGKGKLK